MNHKLSNAQISANIHHKINQFLLYYLEACNEFAGPISKSLRPGNTASFEEMSLRWQHCVWFNRPKIWT